MQNFSSDMQHFADMFITVQERRYRADYALDANFDKSGVLRIIDDAELAIEKFEYTDRRERRTFAARALFRQRSL